ncbi:MAG: RDD family protein [Candidatus Hodarchaeota archaeon]
MKVKVEITSKAEFLNQVSSWLPYRTSRKKEWLQELNLDLQTAYEDTSTNLAAIERWNQVIDEFGTPQEVAENLIATQAEALPQASYLLRVLAYLVDAIIVSSLLFILLFIESQFFFATKIDLEYRYLGFKNEDSHLILLILVYYTDYASGWEFAFIRFDYFFELLYLTVIILLNLPSILADIPSIYGELILSLFLALNIMVISLYFFTLEACYGSTIGKSLFRLRVVSETGIRITWPQALVRNLSKFNPQILVLDLIVGWVKKTNGQRGLDAAAKTQVIYDF